MSNLQQSYEEIKALWEQRDLAKSARIEQLERERDEAYLERNQLVALLASVYPSGIKRTAINGWHEDWHGCVYIDFPWGQASWHYHVSQADLFLHLPSYQGQWDGHSTEAKYTAIVEASRKDNNAEAKLAKAAEALREFAKQKRTTEMDVDEYDQADIEGAYCQFIFKAHAVLAELVGKE